jgi:hypothetical protein
MVHSSLVKMTGQMVYTLLIRNTTLVTLDMLNQVVQNDKGFFWPPVQILL